MQVFYSYSHEDKDLREALEKHFAVLRQNQLINEWHDGAINPGEQWDAAIKENLRKADIILLLVSADFLASKYIWEVELQIAIQRHQAGQAQIIPIILRPCDWRNSILGTLKALPEDGEPITTWGNQDEACLQVAEGIRQLLSTSAPPHTAQSVASSAIVITTPPLVKDWVGRSEETTQLQSWMTNPDTTLIGIQGLGGMGKSTLAAYLFDQFQANPSLQQSAVKIDHFLWADVTQRPDFAAFAETILRGLGVRLTAGGDTYQLMQQLIGCLQQESCLLVVDNLESLLSETGEWLDSAYAQFFSDWLQQGQKSRLLLTTREKPKLFQGLSSWRTLLGLPRSEGGLLLQRLEVQGTVAELEAFAQLVDGHPLTLKLVAGFLREYCEGQLQQVAELELATEELVYQEAEGRHRERQNARISWILEQHLQRLSDEEKQFLLNLSVFRQGFDREAAGWMWVERQEAEGRSGEQVKPIVIVKALKGLCNRSLLLDLGGGAYQFQLLVQGYLQQRAEDFRAAHQQAIAYYRTQFKLEPWDDLSDLNAYLEAFYHHCRRQDYAQAYDVMFSCFTFLDLRGYYQTLVDVYGKLAREWQPETDADKANWGWSWILLGNSYRNLGQYPLAIDAHEKANQIFTAISHQEGTAASLGNLGNAYNSLGEYQRAIDFHQQSLKIKREIGDRQGEASSLGNLGLAYYSLGEYQRAIEYHQQDLEIAREIGDRQGEANSLGNLGLAYNSLGEYQRAIEYFQQHLEIAREIGDRQGEAKSLGNLGIAYNSLGEYQRAIEYQQQHLEIAREIGDRQGEAHSLGNLGLAYYSLGEYQRAIEYHQQSLKIDREIGDRQGEASSLGNLGSAYYSLGEYQRAIEYHQQSLKIKREIGDRRGEANSWFNSGLSLKKLNRPSEAMTAFENARNLYQAMSLDTWVQRCNDELNQD